MFVKKEHNLIWSPLVLSPAFLAQLKLWFELLFMQYNDTFCWQKHWLAFISITKFGKRQRRLNKQPYQLLDGQPSSKFPMAFFLMTNQDRYTHLDHWIQHLLVYHVHQNEFLRNLHQVVFVIYVNITLYIISFFIGLTFSLLNKIGRIE